MAKRAQKASERLSRADGWASLVTGLGTSRDRRTTGAFSSARLPYAQLADMYRGEDLAGRIVELLPGEMLRRGFTVSIKDDKDSAEAVKARLDELDAESIIEQALCWARAFGGAGVLLGANDGQTDLAKPLNLDAIRSLDWLTALDSQELQPERYYTDPTHPRFGRPEAYRITPQVATDGKSHLRLVHESRVLRFDGVVVTRRQTQENGGWGDSVLLRVFEVLRDFGAAWGGAAHLLTEFGQGELKIPGLLELVATTKGQADLMTRLRAMELMRSTVRAMVVDGGDGTGQGGESFERKATPVTGLADLLDKFSLRVAAAARTPVSLLMGQAPGGLNATGDSDIRWFYDQVAAAQRKQLKPQLNRLVKILLRAKAGPTGGREPETWSIAFPPLWEMTDAEKATLRKTQAETDQIYLASGVLDPAEVAISRFGGEEYSTDTLLDLATREAMDPAAPVEPEPAEEEPQQPPPAPTPARATTMAPTVDALDPVVTTRPVSGRQRVENRVATLAVFNGAGHMLWGRRRDNGRWTTPGGHLGVFEQPEVGAVRELEEEAALCPGGPLVYLGSIRLEQLEVFAYLATCYGAPTSENDPDEEVENWEWVDVTRGLPAQLRENLHVPAERNAFARFLPALFPTP